MNKDIEEHVCDYGCGNKAYFYFKSANKWCCSSRFSGCQSYKDKLRDIHLSNNINNDTLKHKVLRDIRDGIAVCYYCGKPAKYVVSKGYPCCSNFSKSCPEYKVWLSNNKKEFYKNNPEYKERMRKIINDIQHRPDVIKKKSKSMTILHSGDCIPCVEFKENYNNGRIVFRDKLHKKNYKTLVKLGVPIKHIPLDIEERSLFLARIRYMKARHKERLYMKGSISNKVEVSND